MTEEKLRTEPDQPEQPVEALEIRHVFHMPSFRVAGIKTTMVGRDAEIMILQNMFLNATEDAEVHVVTVVGDAGLGKSRLLYEFQNWLDGQPHQIWTLIGRAAPELQATPYGLLRQMFAYRFNILESDSAAAVREKFRAGMAPNLNSFQADLVGQLLGLDFSHSQAVQAHLGTDNLAKSAEGYLTQYLQAVAKEIDDRQLIADLLNNTGYLNHHSIKNLGKAKRYYEESLLIAREIGHRSGATSTLINLGHLHILLEEHQVAWSTLREAMNETVAIGAVPLTLDALVGIAQLQLVEAQYQAAAELLGLALNHPALEHDSRQLAESIIASLRNVMTADGLEVALACGEKMEPQTVVEELNANE